MKKISRIFCCLTNWKNKSQGKFLVWKGGNFLGQTFLLSYVKPMSFHGYQIEDNNSEYFFLMDQVFI